MTRTHLTRSLTAVTLLLAVTLTGCAAVGDSPTAATSQAAPATGTGGQDGQRLLQRFNLTGLDAVAAIDRLDRLGGSQRPATLKASVRPTELQLSGDGDRTALPLPADRFYLSIAPYLTRTHDCFYHSLTTCQGELSGVRVHVRIVGADGTVLVDTATRTFANGFVGFWLPRDTTGTVTVTHDGKRGNAAFSTTPAAPTCLTSLRLS